VFSLSKRLVIWMARGEAERMKGEFFGVSLGKRAFGRFFDPARFRAGVNEARLGRRSTAQG
jgi:hypothetical protein